jgi:hypothetical protein
VVEGGTFSFQGILAPSLAAAYLASAEETFVGDLLDKSREKGMHKDKDKGIEIFFSTLQSLISN